MDLGSVFFGCILEGKRHFLGCGESRQKRDHHASGDIYTITPPPPGSTSLFPGGLCHWEAGHVMPEWDLSFHVMSCMFFLDTISSTTWA